MSTKVLALLLLVCYGGCYRDVPVIQRTVRIERQRVPVNCLTVPPPEPPLPTDCVVLGISVADCSDIDNARWHDYGSLAEEWIRLYAWPRCRDAVGR